VVVFSWTNYTDAGYTNNTWTVVAPPNLTTVAAPVLPPAAAGWTPATFTYAGYSTITVMSGDGFKTYADFRQVAALLPPPNYTNLPTAVVPLLPFDGTLALTVVGPCINCE